jgi:hypothetical protein
MLIQLRIRNAKIIGEKTTWTNQDNMGPPQELGTPIPQKNKFKIGDLAIRNISWSTPAGIVRQKMGSLG